MREEGGRKRREGGERSEGRALVSSVVVTFLPDARVAMEESAAALARPVAGLESHPAYGRERCTEIGEGCAFAALDWRAEQRTGRVASTAIRVGKAVRLDLR